MGFSAILAKPLVFNFDVRAICAHILATLFVH